MIYRNTHGPDTHNINMYIYFIYNIYTHCPDTYNINIYYIYIHMYASKYININCLKCDFV